MLSDLLLISPGHQPNNNMEHQQDDSLPAGSDSGHVDPSLFLQLSHPQESTLPLPEPVQGSDTCLEPWMIPHGSEALKALPVPIFENPSVFPTELLPLPVRNAPGEPAREPFIAPELLNWKATGDSVYDPDSDLGASGRFYHGYKDGKYFLPNDAVGLLLRLWYGSWVCLLRMRQAEQARLDYQHKGFEILTKGRLSLAPMVTAPAHVLDVATGTGIWAIKFGNRPQLAANFDNVAKIIPS